MITAKDAKGLATTIGVNENIIKEAEILVSKLIEERAIYGHNYVEVHIGNFYNVPLNQFQVSTLSRSIQETLKQHGYHLKNNYDSFLLEIYW
jgi:hypothetical protein